MSRFADVLTCIIARRDLRDSSRISLGAMRRRSRPEVPVRARITDIERRRALDAVLCWHLLVLERSSDSRCARSDTVSLLSLRRRGFRSHARFFARLLRKPFGSRPMFSPLRANSPCSRQTRWTRPHVELTLRGRPVGPVPRSATRPRRGRISPTARPSHCPCRAPDLLHCAACIRGWPPLPRGIRGAAVHHAHALRTRTTQALSRV
jgi:hypothetical protein